MKWLFAVLLVLQAHFTASYLVPLDREAQGTFGDLLRWAWPWSIGDGGLLGRISAGIDKLSATDGLSKKGVTTIGSPCAGITAAVSRSERHH